MDTPNYGKELHRLSQIYRLPNALNDKLTLISSSTYLDTYHSLIQPSNHSNSYNEFGEYIGSGNNNNDVDFFVEDSANISHTSTASIGNTANSIINNTINNINNNTIGNLNNSAGIDGNNLTNTNVNNNSNNNIGNNASSNSNGRNGIIIIGHGITKNGGIPLNNISKIPSYQWGFKHDEDSHHINVNNNSSNNHSDNVKNNQLINHESIYESDIHKSKYILSNLNLNNDVSSISSLPGTSPNHRSMALNSRLVRLPLKNDDLSNINSYDLNNTLKINDIDQGGLNRSLMNGLPYYNKKFIDLIVQKLNIEKKINWKTFNTNTSWFSNYLNETIDDIEYLHGEVILNKFLNNKRIIRNFQWLNYWNYTIGGSNLKKILLENNSNSDSDTHLLNFQQFEISVKLRNKKFKDCQTKAKSIIVELQKIKIEKDNKKKQYYSQFGNLPSKLMDDLALIDIADIADNGDNGDNGDTNDTNKYNKETIEFYGSELLEKEQSLKKEFLELPKYEEEIEVDMDEINNEILQSDKNTDTNSDNNSDNNDNSTIEKDDDLIPRFNNNEELIKKNEFVINKEFSVTDPNLVNIQNTIYGLSKSTKLTNDLNMINSKFKTKKIITSKIVKIKRRPNPNALGFSNIRNHKPSYL